MNNKLFFRILGALASALIVVSVFIPFISVTGYSTSIWDSNELTNSLYLPIMIIAFGVIGVIFFSLNIKTEFAYMSTGAIIFFLVMQTIDILDQGAFNALGIGYYLLILGTLLTGLMAFLTNLKPKKKIQEISPVLTNNQPTMVDQIDKLYNDQAIPQNEISPIQPITNVIEPIPVQPIDNIQSRKIEPIVEAQVSNDTIEQSVEQVPNADPVAPIPVVEIQQQVIQQPVNPVLKEFSNSVLTNIATQDFSIPEVKEQPVVQERYATQPNVSPQPNPVVNEFANPSSTSESQQSSGLDIFGQ